jgi:hypothetical protein
MAETAQRDPLDFEITEAERRHLKTMLASPGYIVLRKIADAYIDAARETALTISALDPLANADKIAQKWAYVSMSQQFMECLNSGVDFELQMLARADRTPTNPADLARRRREHVAFGALDPPPEV